MEKKIYLPGNEYQALKLHWAGGHSVAWICEKCKIIRERYRELLDLASKDDIIILVDNGVPK